ncbi:MAG: hypothetical protein EPN88_08140 [Bacteroidetes bacterium]|nr:MAG: hypothetical protein EPN88_08140 [Bacteroidota bacterium]
MNFINKIVQTLWTKPVFEDESNEVQNRFHGGWLSKKYNYMAWTLSCLQFKKFYDNVELVTDKRGKQLLIDILNLPYTSVRVELDCLNHYPTSLWTLPKIYTYKIQEEPFIHVDGDVFIWEKFGKNVESAQLCSQQLVIDHKPQYITIEEIETHLNFIPACIRKNRAENKVLRISNAGLFGGTDLDFFREFVKLSFEFVDKNLSQLSKLKSGNFGMIFEEYLFYCLAKEKGIEVTYLLEPLVDNFTGTRLVDFETIPSKTIFIHPVGTYKKYQQICDLLASTLLMNYPDHYYRIMSLLHAFEI